ASWRSRSSSVPARDGSCSSPRTSWATSRSPWGCTTPSPPGTAQGSCPSARAGTCSPVVFDDLHFDFRSYDPLAAYGQSKTADALLAVAATRRWSGEGIYANALNPGAIATGLQKHTGGLKTPKERQKTVQQGAATSVLLAA